MTYRFKIRSHPFDPQVRYPDDDECAKCGALEWEHEESRLAPAVNSKPTDWRTE